MSVPIFRRPDPINPFAGAQQSIGQGINQMVEQRALNEALGRVEQGEVDPLTAILESGLPAERQNQLANIFQQQAETERKAEANSLLNALFGAPVAGSLSPEQQPATPAQQSFINEGVDPTGPAQVQQGNIGIRNIPDEQLQFLSVHNDPRIRQAAELESRRREQNDKRFLSDRDFNTKASQRFVNRIDDSRDRVRELDLAGKQMVQATESGDNGIFSRNNLARITGIDAFRDAKGQQLTSAGKEYFLANLSRVKGRPNQYLEQQLAQALPQIGQSQSAQMVAAKMALTNSSILSKEIEIADRLIQEDLQNRGFVGADISQRVTKELAPIAEKMEKNLAYDIRKIEESQKNSRELRQFILKKVPKGTIATPKTMQTFVQYNDGNKEKARSQAKRLGYIIPTRGEIIEFEGLQFEENI